MKHVAKYLISFLILCGITSCNTSKKKPSHKTSTQSEFLKPQHYSMDTMRLSISWTAYKFTNKVAVSGTFDTYSLDTKNTSGTVENILNKSKLSITTASVNSNNAIRNFKLDTYFFKAFNTSEIRGRIIRAKEIEGFIDLKMNSRSKKIPFTYAIKNDSIQLFTNLHLNHWNGENAIKILNTECYEFHKGVDGVSKLCPNIDVVIKIPILKTNNNLNHEL